MGIYKTTKRKHDTRRNLKSNRDNQPGSLISHILHHHKKNLFILFYLRI